MSNQKEIKRLERIANDERHPTKQLHAIYKLYGLLGIDLLGYIENGKAV